MRKQSIVVFVTVLTVVCQLALVSATHCSADGYELRVECDCNHDVFFNIDSCQDQLTDKDLSKLSELTWHGCQLPDDLEAFSKISHVSEVEFAQFDACNSSEIKLKKSFFESIPKVRQLYLDNFIINLTVGAFENVSTLITIHLANNNINQLRKDSFLGAENLQHLALFLANLSYLETSAFRGLANLKYLNLANNNLTRLLKGQLDGLHSLEGLVLSKNNLEFLEEGVFDDMKMLKNLFLNYNPSLSNLEPNLFQFNTKLWFLSLESNSLSNLSNDVFQTNNELEKLYLGKNKLERLPDGLFEKLEVLKKLELYGNKLGLIDNSSNVFNNLRTLKKLETLDLSSNYLNYFPKEITIGEMNSLESLDLSFNNISGDLKVDDLIGPGDKNLKINLEYNRITSINFTDAQNVLTRKLTIILKGNTVSCDCQNYDLFRYFAGNLKLDNVDFDFGDPLCSGPRIHQNSRIKEFRMDLNFELTCTLEKYFKNKKITVDAN